MRNDFPYACMIALCLLIPPASSRQPVNAPTLMTAETFHRHEVQTLMGKEVQSSTGDHLGRIIDILVEANGHVVAAVIDFGGFLGLGARKIAVAWDALRFTPDAEQDRITLDFTREQIKAAPKYKDDQSVVVMGAAADADGARQSLDPSTMSAPGRSAH